MNYFFATHEEAKAINKNNSGMFLRLLRDQPPEGSVIIHIYESYAVFERWELEDDPYSLTIDNYKRSMRHSYLIPIRYPSGIYGVKTSVWCLSYFPMKALLVSDNVTETYSDS